MGKELSIQSLRFAIKKTLQAKKNLVMTQVAINHGFDASSDRVYRVSLSTPLNYINNHLKIFSMLYVEQIVKKARSEQNSLDSFRLVINNLHRKQKEEKRDLKQTKKTSLESKLISASLQISLSFRSKLIKSLQEEYNKEKQDYITKQNKKFFSKK